MKEFLKLLLIIFSLTPVWIYGQFGDRTILPVGWYEDYNFNNVKTIHLEPSDKEIDRLKTIKGASYVSATSINTAIKFSDFSLVEILPSHDKVFRLIISSKDALGIMLYFENFNLAEGAKLSIYDIAKSKFVGSYTAKDNYSKNQAFLSSYVLGDEIVVEYIEPKDISSPNFNISKVYHFFRGLKSSNGNGFGQAPSCMLNAACPEGSTKPAARDATCRILVTGPNFAGFCSGTLMNNTSQDKTPYILTANHCSANSTINDLVNWEFDFLYESSTCANPPLEPTPIKFKGATAIAYSGTDNGEASSDFLLVRLNSSLSSSSYDFTFMGWDLSNSNFTSNVCYHHPNGDIKKVSHSFGSSELVSYGGLVSNTHLKVIWSRTTNGHSVTAEGSSGSGLINSAGNLVGTLTAGDALCTNLNGSDLYGRMFMHWDKFGSAANQRLKPWLDPTNSGVTTLKPVKLSGAPASISNEKSIRSLEILESNQNEIQLNWYTANYEVNIYNSIGKKVLNTNVTGLNKYIDLAHLSRGLYFIEAVHDGNREVLKLDW